MYLKSLVLHGFKSFAQRVELLFPRGVTAIVGPNGSGKSNVSDAIRWVLGEQNIRNLRGSALQDVIFAGTHGRKPLGMAEVTLTLDNSDFTLPLEYNEIAITRRTYRSGESEFFINGTPCRLRDIHDLLMDTGLGRGTMSIIGQGEVDAILSARPEERRALLEDVAGIARYRSKRREAMDRLAETESDLVRVNDIIAEVERQLEPLEKEAQRAAQYKEYRGRLQVLEKQLILHDWSIRKEACDLWEARHAEALAELARAREHLAQVQRERDAADAALSEAQGRATEQQQSLQDLERQHEHLGSQVRVLTERLSGLQAEGQRLETVLQDLDKEQAVHENQLADLRRQRVACAQRLAEAEALVAESEQELTGKRLEIEELRAELQKLRSAAMEHYEQAATAQSELQQIRQAIRAAEERVEQKLADLESRRERLTATENDMAAVENEVVRLEATRSELSTLHANLGENGGDLEKSLAQLRERSEKLRANLTALQSQRDALLALEESLEGFHEGVRACLQANEPWRQGVFGAVGSLLHVEPAHEVALEVALGAAMQNIVVADAETAQAAIDYLKRTQAGRVTFLPLASLRVSQPIIPGAGVREDAEFVGMAADLVSYDKAIEPAVHYLLGRVVVARTLAGAVRLSRQLPSHARVVSLEGDLVLASGPITGGHGRQRRQGSGLLSRGHRLEKLASAVDAGKKQLDKLRAQQRALEERIASVRTERLDIEGRLQEVLKEMGERQRRRDVLRERVQVLQEELQRLNAELERETAALKELQTRAAAAAERLGTLSTDKEQHSTEVDRMEEQLAVREEELRTLEELRGERRALAAEIGAELRGLDSDIAKAEAALTRLHETREQEKAAKQSVQERLDETTRAIEKTRGEMAKCQEEIQVKAKLLQDLQIELSRCREVLSARQAQEEEARSKVEAAGEAVHRIELGLERERAAYGQIIERMLELEIPQPESTVGCQLESVDSVRAEVRRLTAQIRALGDVNVHALEDFAALQERHAFLSSQRDDLVEAKQGLEAAIAEMDATSRERLQVTFSAVQDALQEVFPRLFGEGGKVELQWTNPEDPLQSGIDMIVQPPGKRKQPLLTLSGGERALAAASLLFAIMSVRPSPFFVLDEVDAALDEANVERFAQLLQEYGTRNQIIVITHRQGTMEKADALFGVTMERQGASQLVSLRLNDALAASS